MACTAIILAGGKSSRMGTDKALLPFHGKTPVERLTDSMGAIAEHVILVNNAPDKFRFLNVRQVTDKQEDQGPLAGIEAGLAASVTDWNIIIACDLPFFQKKVVEQLVIKTQKETGIQAVIPEINGTSHPLSAMYHRSCLAVAKQCLKENRRRVLDMTSHLRTVPLTGIDLLEAGMTETEIETAFFNMNDPEDYEQALSWLDTSHIWGKSDR